MATSNTRKSAAAKSAPAKAAPVKEADAPVAEPVVEPEAVEPEAVVEDASSDAPRKEPAAAQIDAPEPPPAPAGIVPTNVIKDNSGQLSIDMVTQGPPEVRSELVDFATGKAPNPDEVFDLEFPHGQAVICQIRLCENLWPIGANEPLSRLVMAAGQRTDRAYADQIVALLEAQAARDAQAAEPAEV